MRKLLIICLLFLFTSVASADLVGYWSFNGSDGITEDTAIDTSGEGNDGIIYGAVAIAGKLGQALSFDGINDYVDCNSDMIDTGAGSICAWIYPTGWGEGVTDAGRIIDNGKVVFFLQKSVEYIRFTSDGFSSVASSANSSISLNQWQHVCVTRNSDGSQTNIYVNGALSSLANRNSGTPAPGITNVFIGNNSIGSKAFDGKIDEVRIYDEALDAPAILALYQRGRNILMTPSASGKVKMNPNFAGKLRLTEE